MHTLVQAASRALVQQDADELERLVEAALAQSARPLSLNLRELSEATDVFARQVRAAEVHLEISSYAATQKEHNPWAR
jgi:methanogenic corrinoid protein MtbC1